MLQNAYLLAKIGADTAENERNIDKNFPKKMATTPTPPRGPRLLPAEPPRPRGNARGALGGGADARTRVVNRWLSRTLAFFFADVRQLLVLLTKLARTFAKCQLGMRIFQTLAKRWWVLVSVFPNIREFLVGPRKHLQFFNFSPLQGKSIDAQKKIDTTGRGE